MLWQFLLIFANGLLPYCRHFSSFLLLLWYIVVLVFLRIFFYLFFSSTTKIFWIVYWPLSSHLKMLPLASTSNEELEDFHCKIVLVGDCKCGKTALIHQFVNDEFLQVCKSWDYFCIIAIRKFSYMLYGWEYLFKLLENGFFVFTRSLIPSLWIKQRVNLKKRILKWIPFVGIFSRFHWIHWCKMNF